MEMLMIRKEGMRYMHVTKTEALVSTMNYIFILSKHDCSMELIPELQRVTCRHKPWSPVVD